MAMAPLNPADVSAQPPNDPYLPLKIRALLRNPIDALCWGSWDECAVSCLDFSLGVSLENSNSLACQSWFCVHRRQAAEQSGQVVLGRKRGERRGGERRRAGGRHAGWDSVEYFNEQNLVCISFKNIHSLILHPVLFLEAFPLSSPSLFRKADGLLSYTC